MQSLALLGLLVALSAVAVSCARASAEHGSCTVERVIDGDTFVCTDGNRVRLLQISAIEIDECGGEWAAAMLRFFLPVGRSVQLEYDEVTEDRYGRHLAAPIVRGTDGEDHNVSILMVYVGVAEAAYYGDNERFLGWAEAAEAWARTAQWNMWAPGGPYNGGCP